MKSKNRLKYALSEQELVSMGYNPKDLWKTRTEVDYKGFKTLFEFKSKILIKKADSVGLTFTRTRTNKKTKVAYGCWLGIQEDFIAYKNVVLPFMLALIKSGVVTDIKKSGDNQ